MNKPTQKPVATIGKIKIYRRTFEAKKHPAGSDTRAILNESSITSEYMTSYKYSLIQFPNFSDSARTKTEAIAKAERYNNP